MIQFVHYGLTNCTGRNIFRRKVDGRPRRDAARAGDERGGGRPGRAAHRAGRPRHPAFAHPGHARGRGEGAGPRLRYVLLDTDAGTEGELPEILSRAEGEGFAGLNITFPYKQAVIGHLGRLSSAAERIGAVNTVVFGEVRQGHNTDCWGFAESLRRGLPDAPMGNVLLLGAGGAGAAVAHALADMGAGRIRIADTREGAAEALAEAVPRAKPAGDLARAAAEADGIVNATPVGMAKLPGTPIDPSLIEARHWVADIGLLPTGDRAAEGRPRPRLPHPRWRGHGGFPRPCGPSSSSPGAPRMPSACRQPSAPPGRSGAHEDRHRHRLHLRQPRGQDRGHRRRRLHRDRDI